jgi:hypothetical protein
MEGGERTLSSTRSQRLPDNVSDACEALVDTGYLVSDTRHASAPSLSPRRKAQGKRGGENSILARHKDRGPDSQY